MSKYNVFYLMFNQFFKNIKQNLLLYIKLSICFFFLSSCIKWDPQDSRKIPSSGPERAKQNVAEGRGVTLGGIVGGKSTTYEFSTSNPMWRASLEVLDFLPMSVVDYSGGMLITDWYSDEVNSNSSLKITIRFLNNEINTNSLKITVHEKNCITVSNCNIKILDSRLKEELIASILKQATILEKETKKK